MPRVASFEFYDDPVAHTGASTCTINWAASTVTWPGVLNVPFVVLPNVKADIYALADQSLADGEADVKRDIYNGTSLVLSVSAAVDMATAVVTTITPGTAAVSKAKAKDLA